MKKPNTNEPAVANVKKIRTNVRAGGLLDDGGPPGPRLPPLGPDGEPLPPLWV